VSMRGARGLLISISGGPDLTLYEVDEAATRIREEVDPEANIILGATFDDSLEGTMRVSVVATGLAVDGVAFGSHEDEEQEDRQVFGFTGKQPETVKIIKPAPLAPRAAPVAPQPVAFEEEHHEEEMEVEPEQVAARSNVRMPAVEEFPAIAQKQIAAQQSRVNVIAAQSAKKKMGIFERLATVGIGRREEPAAAPATRAEPSMVKRPQPQRYAPPAAHTPPAPVQEEATYEDDQLAIPAFLRRQAHG
jgi:cell division protein FtsZ